MFRESSLVVFFRKKTIQCCPFCLILLWACWQNVLGNPTAAHITRIAASWAPARSRPWLILLQRKPFIDIFSRCSSQLPRCHSRRNSKRTAARHRRRDARCCAKRPGNCVMQPGKHLRMPRHAVPNSWAAPSTALEPHKNLEEFLRHTRATCLQT